MAVRMHLGMIGDDAWDKMVEQFQAEYPSWEWFNTWMKKHFNAIEVTGRPDLTDVGDFRVYEFDSKEKYMEFCLRWL